VLERDIERILHDALRRLGVDIRREQLDFGSGGFCRLDNDPVIVYPPDMSIKKRIELFLQALRKLDTSGIYLPPVIREKLDEQDSDPD
jgi:hypothetical protein